MDKQLKNILPFLKWWPLVNKSTLRADSLAGLTNAVVVLPQGVAFAMIAGLPPIYGLYTAMIVPVVAAMFGSSFHLISGPTTAISIVVFSALSGFAEPGSDYYIKLAFTLTFLAGAIQLLIGLARMGTLVNFVSHSVIVGFTSGAAILIATSQISHAFGLAIPHKTAFLGKWQYLFQHLPEVNNYVLGITITTLLSAILIKKIFPKLPHLLLAMLVGSGVNYFINGDAHGVEMVGQFDATIPVFEIPMLSFDNIIMLTPNALAIALLGLIEAVAIARSIALKSHQNLDGNQEFIGQGLSNIVGSFFSSYAGSGSFTRSGINYESGAKTPLSAVFAALSLMIILLLVAPLMAHLPIAAMAGIIFLVSYNLIDIKQIRQIAKTSKAELVVFGITFISTLFFNLEYAIYIGVIISLIVYLNRTSKPHIEEIAPNEEGKAGRHFKIISPSKDARCPQLVVLKISGPMFFGAVEHISKYLDRLLHENVQNVLLAANEVSFLDMAGAELLVSKSNKFKSENANLYICGLKNSIRKVMIRGQYDTAFGKGEIFENKEIAIAEIYQKLDKTICETCEIKVFKECNQG